MTSTEQNSDGPASTGTRHTVYLAGRELPLTVVAENWKSDGAGALFFNGNHVVAAVRGDCLVAIVEQDAEG